MKTVEEAAYEWLNNTFPSDVLEFDDGDMHASFIAGAAHSRAEERGLYDDGYDDGLSEGKRIGRAEGAAKERERILKLIHAVINGMMDSDEIPDDISAEQELERLSRALIVNAFTRLDRSIRQRGER